MDILIHWVYPCFMAFCASVSFSIVFNIRRRNLLLAGVGGFLGWLFYLLSGLIFDNDIFCYFVASIVISLASEIMARLFKSPASIFTAPAVIPLVPGGGIYYTMLFFIQGNQQAGLEKGLHTLGIAGAMAFGIIIVSSAFRIQSDLKYMHRHPDDK